MWRDEIENNKSGKIKQDVNLQVAFVMHLFFCYGEIGDEKMPTLDNGLKENNVDEPPGLWRKHIRSNESKDKRHYKDNEVFPWPKNACDMH